MATTTPPPPPTAAHLLEDAIPDLLLAVPAETETGSPQGSGSPVAVSPTALPMVPVTIISGFLGAGKTTLLNYILSADHGKRIAVIENEFGEEIGVESLIAKDGANGRVFDDFYELSNGCICCSVRDDLLNTLERLLERRDRFDYILIETTGMANPGKVASMFWVDAELEGRIYLDGIVTLVDAPRISYLLDHRDTQLEAASQLAYADRILLNKQDLLLSGAESEREAIERRVREINGVASLRWTHRANVDLNAVLHIQSFTTQRAQEVEALLARGQSPDAGGEGPKIHTGGVQTTCITIPGRAFDQDKLERWLGTLLWEQEAREGAHEAKFFRIKGVLAIAGAPHKFVLQAVHELFEIYATDEPWSVDDDGNGNGDGAPASRIVFIGLHLQRPMLEAGLRECLA